MPKKKKEVKNAIIETKLSGPSPDEGLKTIGKDMYWEPIVPNAKVKDNLINIL
tara:strand:+ start:1971 stop:2129 length:159 start_codon:yes stop_codon:yes gene_type:complete